MSDFGTMQTRIADELNKTNYGDQIKRSIITCIKRYRNKRFKFNYSSTDISTSSSQMLYDLPTGFMGDEILEMIDGNFNDTMVKRDYSWIADQDNHDSYVSEPRNYAIISDTKFRIFPRANAASNSSSGDYTMRMHYWMDLNNISFSSSDVITNAWMTDGEELIRLDAKIDIYTNLLRGQESKAEAAALVPQRNAAYNALDLEYKKSVGSGTLQPT